MHCSQARTLLSIDWFGNGVADIKCFWWCYWWEPLTHVGCVNHWYKSWLACSSFLLILPSVFIRTCLCESQVSSTCQFDLDCGSGKCNCMPCQWQNQVHVQVVVRQPYGSQMAMHTTYDTGLSAGLPWTAWFLITEISLKLIYDYCGLFLWGILCRKVFEWAGQGTISDLA